MLFALLEHHQALGTHWDLLVQCPGMTRLLTWRLARNPLQAQGLIPAELIAPHRQAYLSFEGPIGRGRGFVRRLDRGSVVWHQLTPGQWRFVLAGSVLHGSVVIVGAPRGRLRLTPEADV